MPVGVVTSSGEHEVAPILVKEDVRESLSLLVCGDQVQNLKPNPEPYLLALERATAAAQAHGHATDHSLRVPGAGGLRSRYHRR